MYLNDLRGSSFVGCSLFRALYALPVAFEESSYSPRLEHSIYDEIGHCFCRAPVDPLYLVHDNGQLMC
jgi:hypothetical protein